ncbi:MAG: TIGR00725 family protein [Candidatus Omnitrophota bacterium]|nr:MAG: TIGR00725 family protein [Candidatus Omnitrophota bacterium]RKY45681.1 MAG: TIGR00725 family protein [Candidatus Omnitrophota bacterium]HDN86266.1 TIGR00725 family protein [Candidatus Omnitrophota bacterium]
MNVGVIGGYSCSKRAYKLAREIGRLIAQEGWILICGGGSGVMEAACLGAKEKGGITCGILPSYTGEEANPYLDIKIPTGLGYARNILVVRASHCLVAIDGKYGTLSEIAFALSEGKPVLGIDTWDIEGVVKVENPQKAIEYIKRKIL